VWDAIDLAAAQEFSNSTSAAILAGFVVVFALLAWLLLRGKGDLPPGYGTPGSGRKDRRVWAGISVMGAVGCFVLAIVFLFATP
jgi:hypothetical protein